MGQLQRVIQAQRTSDNHLLFKSISLNGQTATLNYYEIPTPTTWYGITINYQQDGNYKQQPYSIWLDKLTFTLVGLRALADTAVGYMRGAAREGASALLRARLIRSCNQFRPFGSLDNPKRCALHPSVVHKSLALVVESE